MNKKLKTLNSLPWFKFWTGHFRSMTDHLSNVEVGAYVRLLASYWEKNGLPFNQRALNRIAKIEPEDDVDVAAIVGEFFNVEDGTIIHEHLDALRVEAIGEEDAKKRRTLSARLALAEQRKSVTFPVADTYVNIDDVEREETPTNQMDSQTANHQIEIRDPQMNQMDSETGNLQMDRETEPPNKDSQEDSALRQLAIGSGPQISVQAAPTRTRQSVSLKPDGGAPRGAVPAAGSAQSGISFLLADGGSIPLSAFVEEGTLVPSEMLVPMKQLAERFASIPETRVTADELPDIIEGWRRRSRRAA